MKTLILTMTSGEGHNNIAKVISESLSAKGVECKTIDIFRHNGFEYKFNNLGYLFVCSRFPRIYDYFWKKLKFRNSNRRYHGVAQREVDKVANFIAKQAEDFRPDFFLCVHPYCAMLCDLWKRQGRFENITSIAILTDILPHPLWESAIRCDYVLTPTPHSLQQLQFKGFETKQIVVSGFPVAQKFTQETAKTTARQQLGLQDKFTVMIASGGFGIGKNWKVAKKLLKCDAQILCVNGRNKKAFAKTQRLAKKHPNNLLNYSFVSNMDQLMSASDVIVSRGGCNSLFEAMSKRLPVIIREKSIINERENSEVLQKQGAVIQLKKLRDIVDVVKNLQQNAQQLEAMRQACLAVTQGKTVEDVCQTILQLV